MKKVLFFATLLLPFASAMAQSDFDQAISTIVDNNPELESQRQLVKSQRLDDSDANSISNPEVAFSRVWGQHHIGNKLQLDISQSFDWPGLYRMRTLASRNGVSAAEMLVASSELDLSLQAKQLLLELVYVRKKIELTDQMLATFVKLDEAIGNSVKAGDLTILDQKKSRIERYNVETNLMSLQIDEQRVIAQLQGMCAGTELALGGICAYPIEKIYDLADYEQLIDQVDPLIVSQNFTIDQEDYNAKAAMQSRFPSFSVGYQHQAEMGDRFNGFTVGMTLPFFENRHARAAAYTRRDAAKMSQTMLLASKKAELRGQWNEMLILRRQIEAHNDVFGDNTYIEILKKSFDAGQISVHEYFSEMQYITEQSLTLLDAEYNYALIVSSLNKYSLLR